MLAIALDLPKWLLAAVAFCVVLGHLEQIHCKLRGCGSVVVKSVGKTPAKSDSSSKDESDRCSCACHSATTAAFGLPPSLFALRIARDVESIEWYDRAPEAPCAEIEYPPRSFRA